MNFPNQGRDPIDQKRLLMAVAACGAILLLWNWPTFKLLVALGVYSALQWFLIPYFGDVGRYVSTKPDAVATRNEIRERGLKLLETLHDSRRDGSSDGAPEYARIIIIAHSLGSVIASTCCGCSGRPGQCHRRARTDGEHQGG